MNKLLFLLIILSLGCKQPSGNNKKSDTTLPNSVITLTNEQLKMSEIKLGKIELRELAAYFECNGTIEIPPQHLATISAPAGGIIKTANFIAGQKVNKGNVLATLQNAEYVKIQQEYLETTAQLEYFKAEYERQGELTVENAASVKKMQQAQSDYKTLDARHWSLKAQLAILGINAEKLRPENIVSEISLIAPISGVITGFNANIGKYVNLAETIYEIADVSHKHLVLHVFEKNISNLQINQNVKFKTNANPKNEYNAKIEVIGNAINAQTNTIEVHAHILNNNNSLHKGMYVNAYIITNNKPLYCLPTKAFVKDENKYYIFTKQINGFVKTAVTVGIETNNYIEIVNPTKQILTDTVVVEGAYYIDN